MMSMHTGDWPLPPGVVRPTLPPIPVVRPASVPGTAAAAAQPGSTARPATGSAVRRSESSCVQMDRLHGGVANLSGNASGVQSDAARIDLPAWITVHCVEHAAY